MDIEGVESPTTTDAVRVRILVKTTICEANGKPVITPSYSEMHSKSHLPRSSRIHSFAISEYEGSYNKEYYKQLVDYDYPRINETLYHLD